MGEGERPDKRFLCSVWAQLNCVLKQDYRELVDKLLSGSELSELVDALRPALPSCVRDEVARCMVTYDDTKQDWLDYYNKLVALFNALTVLLDTPKFAFIMEQMLQLSDISVAELKGLVDAICKSNAQ